MNINKHLTISTTYNLFPANQCSKVMLTLLQGKTLNSQNNQNAEVQGGASKHLK